jgi:hypothetical protein
VHGRAGVCAGLHTLAVSRPDAGYALGRKLDPILLTSMTKPAGVIRQGQQGRTHWHMPLRRMEQWSSSSTRTSAPTCFADT